LFYLDPRTGLKAIVFLTKFGSDKDWVCQFLIQHVNDNSPVTQKEMEYALCWRQSPIVLFPLEEKKRKKEKKLLLTEIHYPSITPLIL
jgi:hypothetical protein